MMRVLIRSALISIATLTAVSAQEQPKADPSSYPEALGAFVELVHGTTDARTENGQRVIDLVVDRATINDELPELQSLKLLNPDITQTLVNTHPNMVPLVIAIQGAVMEVMTEYSTQKTDRSTVNVSLLVADDYGKKQPIKIFSFGFDRALYNKIDWENFQNSNLEKVAHGFKFTPWASRHLFE